MNSQSAKTIRIPSTVIGPLALFVVWWAAFHLELVTPKLLPSPVETMQSLIESLIGGPMLIDFLYTVERTFYAFIVAAVAGVPLGIVIGASRPLYDSIEFLVDFFRSTPATAMFPLFLLIFGLGDFAKVAVAAFAAFLIIFFNTAYGVMMATKTTTIVVSHDLEEAVYLSDLVLLPASDAAAQFGAASSLPCAMSGPPISWIWRAPCHACAISREPRQAWPSPLLVAQTDGW